MCFAFVVSYRIKMENENAILEQLNREKAIQYLPAIVFAVLVILFGILGNSLSLLFYGFKVTRTATTFLITTLSLTDLVTCVVLVGEVIELCYSVDFRSVAGCKILYFLNHWLVITSGLMLLVISVDRFRRICRPFQWQMSVRIAKLSTLTVLIFGGILSFRDIFVIDVVRVNITRDNSDILTGYYCTHVESANLETVITVFHILDFLTFLGVLVVSSISYACISVKIFKHRKRQGFNTPRVTSPPDVSTTTSATKSDEGNANDESAEMGVSTISGEKKQTLCSTVSGRSFYNRSINSVSGSLSTLMNLMRPRVKRPTIKSNFNAEKKITLMMLCIFITSIVSFIPHFAVNLGMKANGHLSEQEFSVGIQVALRLFMLNNAVNPYIIGAFNTHFRNYVKQLVCRCTQ